MAVNSSTMIGSAASRRAPSASTPMAAGWSFCGSELIGGAGERGDAVAQPGRVALVERRDRGRARRGVDDDGGEPERLVERALRGVDVLDAQHRHQRAGDPDRAVAQVDLLVAHLVAPARPAQLRHDTDRDDRHRERQQHPHGAAHPLAQHSRGDQGGDRHPQALGAPEPAGGRREAAGGLGRHPALVLRVMPTAFVTGGSGFVGGPLIERLARDGWSVRALARSDRAADAVRVRGAAPVRGELGDLSALVAGMEGAGVGFPAARQVEDFGPWHEFVAANVEGTRNVLRACRAAAVGRAVHVSTEAALMHGQPLVHADETYPLAFGSSAPYSRSKAMAEQVVLEEGGGSLDAMIVRPRFVWGRGDTTLLPLLVEATRSGALRWVGGGGHRTSTTHVDNTVEGLLAAAEHGRGGRAYFVTDGAPVVFREFVSELIATQGVTPPEGTVPTSVARALAAAGETAWKLLPLPGLPPLTRFAAWVASQECTLDDSRARSELGYAPVKTREQGMRELRDAV